MRYYLIAGEASGDLHGSNLIKEIKKRDQHAVMRCWGGELMEQAGAAVDKHYRELAFMGFTEVLMNIRTIFKNFKICKENILAFKPDVVILIDYPGFNLRMAKWAKLQNYKVVYYISPQVWAWKENRVKIIKANVDKMLTILPFEKDFYKKWDYNADYVGHPLIEAVERFRVEGLGRKAEFENPTPYTSNLKPLIALLPGSRKQELHHKLPIMLAITKFFPDHTFIIAKAPSQEDELYNEYLKNYPEVLTVRNQTYDLLSKATAACVTSGTATLETALFGVPEVVCYKAGNISYHIAKWLANVKYISLVNLIMDKPIVTELIQEKLTVENLRKELDDILNDPQRIQQMKADYADLKNLLSQDGNASANAAEIIEKLLSEP
ncbi:MAG TPA: lipid-A-disaccharide synthase [Puia sp.]|nr:lipid-A-disaccharide synthase [Puia sp.]